jgi:hypothetical protein
MLIRVASTVIQYESSDAVSHITVWAFQMRPACLVLNEITNTLHSLCILTVPTHCTHCTQLSSTIQMSDEMSDGMSDGMSDEMD